VKWLRNTTKRASETIPTACSAIRMDEKVKMMAVVGVEKAMTNL
jgi:hypothetical protein